MDEYNVYKQSMENAFTAGKEFYNLIKPQEFSFPNSIMKYLWKHPSNPEGYKKLIQSCKFFFVKNPILICPSFFHYSANSETQYWEYCTKYHDCYQNLSKCFLKNIVFEKFRSKLWLLGELHIKHKNFPQNFLPKLYRSDAKRVSLHSDINYLNDVLLLASSAKDLSLAGYILEDNGQQVLLEDFIERFPTIQKLCVYWNEDKHIIPCKDYEKILRHLQKLPTFRKFIFGAVPDSFNIQIFLECVKHLKIQFETRLFYLNESSPEIDNYLAEVVDKLMETKNFDYCPTLIWSYNLEKQMSEKYFPLKDKIEEYLLKIGRAVPRPQAVSPIVKPSAFKKKRRKQKKEDARAKMGHDDLDRELDEYMKARKHPRIEAPPTD